MAAAISNWYHSSLWTRSRQVQVAPLLQQAEENARLNRPPAEAVVINMGDILADDPALLNAIKPKKHETLFGPSLGTINPGPAWTGFGKQNDSGPGAKDELTQETVKAWIAKSKEPSQPTTTLQALVNLKRPSIRLSPLAHNEGPEDAPTTHHGLEFTYDLDAAKGRMILEVISPNPDIAPILIYEAIVDGGFNKQLKVEDGAVFELTKLEYHKAPPPPPVANVTPDEAENAGTGTPGTSAPAGPSNANKKRFSGFHFRKKTRAAGPSIAVVDAQTPALPAANAGDGDEAGAAAGTGAAAGAAGQAGKTDAAASDEEDGGVRVRIRIEALDEDAKALPSPNAQTTYLHIVRMGAPPAPAEGTTTPEEDTRPWVVKVVKREATIGLHTFHLHEIYGLATGSNSSTDAQPAPSHTYPPNANGDEETTQAQAYDFAGTECVLCLSEPREVVLLPCRHLVACKDCAINMIEFGAGGTLTQPADETPAAAAPTTTAVAGANGTTPAANANNVDLEAGNATPAPAPAPAPTAPRRKRKAKGWFCPVCRQPYTSMLRITTTPPETKKLTSASDTELDTTPMANLSVNEPAVPPAAVIAGATHASAPPNIANTNTTTTTNANKPGFLGGFSLGGKNAAGGAKDASGEPRVSTSSQTQQTQPGHGSQDGHAEHSGDPLGATSTTPNAPNAPAPAPAPAESGNGQQ